MLKQGNSYLWRLGPLFPLTKTDYKFFEKAKQAASVLDYRNIHAGCVAVYQGKIIGIGCNMDKTHPTQKYYNRFRSIIGNSANCTPKLHAEIACLNAIQHSDVRFARVKLYVYRVCSNREHGMARPCAACMAAIRDLGIRDVYYTTDDGFSY